MTLEEVRVHFCLAVPTEPGASALPGFRGTGGLEWVGIASVRGPHEGQSITDGCCCPRSLGCPAART